MKGIYIFEENFLKDAVACLKLSNIEHTFRCEFGKTVTEQVEMTALVGNTTTKSRCSKSDTYDFEVGALIALMKMCGVEKVKKAAKETFFDVAENSVNEYEEEIKKLREEIIDLDYRKTCNETTIELLYNTINTLSGIDDKYKELKEENEKLKLDCEKLQHGYIDTDMIFCGGRQNGKQYTFLVDLFKKIDQKKVDAAYKEAYNTKLPVWQREFLKEALSIYKPPTKREQMWNDIKNGEINSVKVERAFINDFLSEAEEHGLVWAHGGEKPTEWDKWEEWSRYDYAVFTIYDNSEYKELTWNIKSEVNTVDYLPPMRWDLFKKGRLVVGIKNMNELEEFRKEVEINTGIKNIPMCPTNLCLFYSFDKDNYKIILKSIERSDISKITGHKVYYWEDVR